MSARSNRLSRQDLARPHPAAPRGALSVALAVLLLAGCSLPEAGDAWPSVHDTGMAAIHEEEGADIGGVVRDATGAQLAGAHVVASPHGYEATTDADGVFTLHDLPSGSYAVQASAEGYAPGDVVQVQLVAGDLVDIDLGVADAAALDGLLTVSLTGPDGAPVEGGVVALSTGETATTDAEGVASIAGLAGQSFDLTATDADGRTWPRTKPGLVVGETGNLQVALTLSGRGSDRAPISSALCAYCHVDQATTWAATGHGGATGLTPDDALLARFTAAESVDLGGPSATLGTDGSSLWVTLTATSGATRSYDVAGFVGDPRRATVPLAELDGRSWPLPVGWTAAGRGRTGFPDAAEGLVATDADAWFDADGSFAFALTDTPDPALSADTRCLPCHVTGTTLSVDADGSATLTATSTGDDPRWLEGDVGCERCHGSGADHISNGVDDAPFEITRPDWLDADRSDDVCGQCHGAHLSLDGGLPYPYTAAAGLFEPGTDLADYAVSSPLSWPSGAAAGPGQQLDEHRVAAHGDAGLRCIDCHDPHGSTTDDAGNALPAMLRADPDDNSLCGGCHQALSFDDSDARMQAHTAHATYDPAGDTEAGRCTGCHMPGTAARLRFGALTGSGDQPSHLFLALPPQDTVDVFDAAGASSLPLGEFPANACLDCHAWNAWRADDLGSSFAGPTGDPTLRSTHEALQAAFEGLYP